MYKYTGKMCIRAQIPFLYILIKNNVMIFQHHKTKTERQRHFFPTDVYLCIARMCVWKMFYFLHFAFLSIERKTRKMKMRQLKNNKQ